MSAKAAQLQAITTITAGPAAVAGVVGPVLDDVIEALVPRLDATVRSVFADAGIDLDTVEGVDINIDLISSGGFEASSGDGVPDDAAPVDAGEVVTGTDVPADATAPVEGADSSPPVDDDQVVEGDGTAAEDSESTDGAG